MLFPPARFSLIICQFTSSPAQRRVMQNNGGRTIARAKFLLCKRKTVCLFIITRKVSHAIRVELVARRLPEEHENIHSKNLYKGQKRYEMLVNAYDGFIGLSEGKSNKRKRS